MRKLWTILTLVAAMLFVSVAAAQVGTAVGVSGSAARSHNVAVTIPTVLLLKLAGSNSGTVTFDFSTEVQAYANAALASTPLVPTASDMTGLQIFTNDQTGAQVQISLSPASNAAEAQVQSDLRFDGLDLATWNSSHTSTGIVYTPSLGTGFQPVFGTAFSLSTSTFPITFVPSTSDTPGSYTITVTYTATAP